MERSHLVIAMNKATNRSKFDLYNDNQKVFSIKNPQPTKYAIINNSQIRQGKNHNVSYDGVRKDIHTRTTSNELVSGFGYLHWQLNSEVDQPKRILGQAPAKYTKDYCKFEETVVKERPGSSHRPRVAFRTDFKTLSSISKPAEVRK